MQCMRVIQCTVVTLTTVTCFAVVLICAFLEDENSMMPALMPAAIQYPMRRPIKTDFFEDKQRSETPQITTTTTTSSGQPETASSFSTSSISSSDPTASTSEGQTTAPQGTTDPKKSHLSTTSIPSSPSQPASPTTRTTKPTKNATGWTIAQEDVVRNRYAIRKKLLTESCLKRPGNFSEKGEEREGRPLMPKLAYFVEKYRLLACVPAKAGATTWKTHLLRMKGYTKPIDNPHVEWVHRMLRARHLLHRQQAAKILRSPSVARVVSVRHPVARLISGYTNKFYNGRLHVPDNVTHKYMKTALEVEGIKLEKGKPIAVTFRQFLNLILHEKERGLANINNHWRPQYSLCDACAVRYDYVVKQETFEEDLQYLVKKLEIAEVNADLKTNVSAKPKNATYEEYFRDIPKDVLREIFQLYEPDFRHFGYAVPQYLLLDGLSRPER